MKKIITALTFVLFSLATIPVSNAATVPSTIPEATADPAVTKAVEDFNSLGKKEKKSRFKEVKKMLKKYKADKRAGQESDENTILLAILAILLPPLAIYLKERKLTWKFWLSLALIVPVFFSAWWAWTFAVALALLVVFNVL